MLTTCNFLNWAIDKAVKTFEDEYVCTWQFRAKNIGFGVVQELREWFKSHDATYNDGRYTSGYTLQLEDVFDHDMRHHWCVTVSYTYSRAAGLVIEVCRFDEFWTEGEDAQVYAPAQQMV